MEPLNRKAYRKDRISKGDSGDVARKSASVERRSGMGDARAVEHLQNAIEFCKDVNDDVMESMFFRTWFRTRVLNDHLPERFFQMIDANWSPVYERVQNHMARYAGSRLQ